MTADGKIIFQLPPASSYCLELTPQAKPITGDDYRRARAQAAWAVTALNEIQAPENIGPHDWRDLAALVEKIPRVSWPRSAHWLPPRPSKIFTPPWNRRSPPNRFPPS